MKFKPEVAANTLFTCVQFLLLINMT